MNMPHDYDFLAWSAFMNDDEFWQFKTKTEKMCSLSFLYQHLSLVVLYFARQM